MPDSAKYIIIIHMGVESPILFPCWVQHCEIAGNINFGYKVVSAGYVNFDDDGKAHCYGKSVSLNDLPSREEDSNIINKTIIRKE